MPYPTELQECYGNAFPFFVLAKKHHLDYGDVLNLADLYLYPQPGRTASEPARLRIEKQLGVAGFRILDTILREYAEAWRAGAIIMGPPLPPMAMPTA